MSSRIEASIKYHNAAEFIKVKARYDPDVIFSSEWTDQGLGVCSTCF